MTQKSYWPHAIICFFFFIFALNGFVLYKAISTSPGLIESNPYERGNNYQQDIDEREASLIHNLTIEPNIVVTDKYKQRLEVKVSQLNRPINAARVIASFKNPSHKARDKQKELLMINNIYQTELTDMVGSWLITYTVLWEGKKFRFDTKLNVPMLDAN